MRLPDRSADGWPIAETLQSLLQTTLYVLKNSSPAIFGGESALKEPLDAGRPGIGDRKYLRESIDFILETRKLLERDWEPRSAPRAVVRRWGPVH